MISDKLTFETTNLRISIIHPFSSFFNPIRMVKYWFQRRIRGFDDSETWSMDTTIAKFILPRLKRFKQVNIAHPDALTEDEWDDVIDKMIWSMEASLNDDMDIHWSKCLDQQKRFREGHDLFHKYYFDLWW